MYELKKNGTGPSSYGKRIYRAAVSQSLRNAGLEGLQVMERALYTPGKQKWGADVQIHSFVTTILGEGELLASGSDCLTAGWVSPGASREVWKKKVLVRNGLRNMDLPERNRGPEGNANITRNRGNCGAVTQTTMVSM